MLTQPFHNGTAKMFGQQNSAMRVKAIWIDFHTLSLEWLGTYYQVSPERLGTILWKGFMAKDMQKVARSKTNLLLIFFEFQCIFCPLQMTQWHIVFSLWCWKTVPNSPIMPSLPVWGALILHYLVLFVVRWMCSVSLYWVATSSPFLYCRLFLWKSTGSGIRRGAEVTSSNWVVDNNRG